MLTTSPNLADPDAVYELIIAAHEGLSEADSHRLNARLILVLANCIGDTAVIAEAIRLARDAAEPGADPRPRPPPPGQSIT